VPSPVPRTVGPSGTVEFFVEFHSLLFAHEWARGGPEHAQPDPTTR
jgi:hypothetical protein